MAWSWIKAGKPIGAYVLNQAKDKQYYWVFVVLMPMDGDFVAVRLKPTSDRLAMIKELYGKLYELEQDPECDLDETVEVLQDALKAAGFENYLEFMTDSLRTEMTTRSETVYEKNVPEMDALKIIETEVVSVSATVTQVTNVFERSKQIPYNMRLQAGRLEGSDGPISVVSGNHRVITQNLTAQVERFQQAAELGIDPVRETSFMTKTAILMAEVVEQFDREHIDDELRHAADGKILRRLRDSYRREANKRITDVSKRARQFTNMSREFRRSIAGLEMTRIMCEIERSKVNGDTAGLDEITTQLYQSEQDLGEVMTTLDMTIATLLSTAQDLREDFQIAA